MATSPDKLKLDRQSLEKQGVFYLDQLGKDTGSPLLWASREANLEVCRKLDEYLGRRPLGRGPWTVEWDIPKHADWLQEELLDHRRLIPSYAKKCFSDAELDSIPEHVIYDDEYHRYLHKKDQDYAEERFRDIIQQCREIARNAERNRKESASEHDWQRFMESDIFKRYHERKASLFDQSVLTIQVRWR